MYVFKYLNTFIVKIIQIDSEQVGVPKTKRD